MKAKRDRNDEILALHDLNPKKYTLGFLAKKYGKSKATVQEIIVREKAKRGDKKALASALIKRKYPQLLKA